MSCELVGPTPVRLREIAAIVLAAPETSPGYLARVTAAQDLELWAVLLEKRPAPPAITWEIQGDNTTLAIDETNGRVLGAISPVSTGAGTVKVWKWSAWDQMYNSFEAAKRAFESRF